jgi:type III restriction enzyme
MPQQFLYEQLDAARSVGMRWPDVPEHVSHNLNPAFPLREYQKEALGRFLHCYGGDFEGKQYPLHFLYWMATGSGKTNIMAGLMLYLYEQGCRNFLFFVHSTNIIRKTEDNFLNPASTKYVFAKKIVIGNKAVNVRKVDNFEDANENDINICFTTIQKMHGDLYIERENRLTMEDFKDKKIVLLSDEAHHTQAATRQGELSGELSQPTWENTVDRVFAQNSGNVLLEFTATMDWTNRAIVDAYRNVVIYRYDLKQFRNDGYSKEPELLPADTDHKGRMIQAIILSQYRQEVAGKHGIKLKPVVLFKAQRTIEQSQQNKELFERIIEHLSGNEIAAIRKRTDSPILQKAFAFFKEHGTSDSLLAHKLKDAFAPSKCLSVNDEKEKENNQLLINSLEDGNNQIRAIFAVQKLNEGWDVLNLFDIVRLYETRDAKNAQPGPTTIAEAQLIGRGARYCPFTTIGGQDKYKRKYDNDLGNELRVLEELHYHCHPGQKSRYIAEIKEALVQTGMKDPDEVEVDFKLKDSFKRSPFFKKGLVWGNKRVPTSYKDVKSIADLGVSRHDITFPVHSGRGQEVRVFAENGNGENGRVSNGSGLQTRTLAVRDMPEHVVRSVLARNDFFSFSALGHYFPGLRSVREFATQAKYLGGLKVIFSGAKEDIERLDNSMLFAGVLRLLTEIEHEMRTNTTEYKGTANFEPSAFHLVFTDRKIKVKKQHGQTVPDGRQAHLANKDWYVFDSHYGNTYENELVDLIGREIVTIGKNFKKVYLIRNERQFKIYNFSDGQGFEPDYLLFLVDKKGKNITYQLFVEPKGPHLAAYDKWKNDMLEEITKHSLKAKPLSIGKSGLYKVLGLPFYMPDSENEFLEKLKKVVA